MTCGHFACRLSGLMSNWRKRLGGLLLVERVQGKDWNVAEAARAAKMDAGTIKRIERGENYEVAKLEQYAEQLGHPIEVWLRKALAIPGDDPMLKITEEHRAEAISPLYSQKGSPVHATAAYSLSHKQTKLVNDLVSDVHAARQPAVPPAAHPRPTRAEGGGRRRRARE